jgi:hypothetical protein
VGGVTAEAVSEGLAMIYADSALDKRSTLQTGASQVVHDLKNCMSVLLLNLGNVEAEPAIENTIQKMNCLLEELAKLISEEDHLKQTGASRTRVHPPQKLRAVTIR